MASQFMGDVCARVGTFQKDGQEKPRYLKVGSWFQNDQGQISIKLLAMPLAPDPQSGVGCWLSLFHQQETNAPAPAPRQQPQQQQRQHQAPRPSSQPAQYDDNVPF